MVAKNNYRKYNLMPSIDQKNACRAIFLFFCLIGMLAGCSGGDPIPDLAEVTGTVTWNGEPLDGALISFTPKQSDKQGRGKSSSGTTDAQGKFTLMYKEDLPGAIIGEHSVFITKNEGEEAGPGIIPTKYNFDSTLTANVKADGPNDFTFDLVK